MPLFSIVMLILAGLGIISIFIVAKFDRPKNPVEISALADNADATGYKQEQEQQPPKSEDDLVYNSVLEWWMITVIVLNFARCIFNIILLVKEWAIFEIMWPLIGLVICDALTVCGGLYMASQKKAGFFIMLGTAIFVILFSCATTIYSVYLQVVPTAFFIIMCLLLFLRKNGRSGWNVLFKKNNEAHIG